METYKQLEEVQEILDAVKPKGKIKKVSESDKKRMRAELKEKQKKLRNSRPDLFE